MTPVDRVARAVKILLGVVVALEGLEEVHFRVKRLRRASSTWWAGVDHRERRRLHIAEAGYIIEQMERAAVATAASKRRGHRAEGAEG